MSNQEATDLSIIIVSWNVRSLLRACLVSLLASSNITWLRADGSAIAGTPFGPGDAVASPGGSDSGALSAHDPSSPVPVTRHPYTAEVIVVDNASTDGTPEIVGMEFPWVQMLANTDNRGFTRANNQGLLLKRGRYVLFLNPDTEVAVDALDLMLSYMESHPEVGVLGPQLRFGDSTLQSSRRRFPTLTTALFESTPLAWHWPNNPWARRYHMADVAADAEQTVDWLVGAALLVRGRTLAQVGGFDEGFFMYSEELDWCRRAVHAGWRVAYLPTACILHHEGKSSEQAIAARHIRFQTSKVRYFRKYHGAGAAAILRLFILLSFAAEWIIEGGKWLLGSRRPLRRERMRAYAQLLRTGLAC